MNGSRAKAHREVRAGDRIGLAGKDGSRRELVVRGLAERSIPKAAARALYEDVTPPPPAEVLEARRLDRLLAPRRDAGRPDKRDRRDRIRSRREIGAEPQPRGIAQPKAFVSAGLTGRPSRSASSAFFKSGEAIFDATRP